jgi:hypothetical protein
MPVPSLPRGYDVATHVQAGRPDCHITVGFDQQQRQIPRFLVQLHYQVSTAPVGWEVIARMDHNETSTTGHDVYREGLHVDVARRSGSTVHLDVAHAPLPSNRGIVIRGCDEYLRREADYFIDVYEGRRSPGGPPRWSPDGGELPHTLICANLLPGGMSQESPVEDALTPEELSELLAEATGTTSEAIERGAAELEIAPPEEATVVDE